jgi:hypothetical protein
LSKKPTGLWYSNAPDITEEVMKNAAFNPVILRLIEILKDRKESIEAKPRNEDIYENPSWSHLQAHLNGRAQEIQYIIQLLSFAETKR